MAASPSYDMVLQILERVNWDVVTLFRCATACKGWRRLIMANPSFIRRCLPEDVCRSAPFPGFFAQLRPRRGCPAPCLVPAPLPVLGGSYRRPLKSFVPSLDDPSFLDHAVPLVSRHGLLLVRLALAGVNPNPMRDGLLAVCNLLTGTLDALPRLEHDCAIHDHEMTGYAILTAVDYSTSTDDDHERHRLPSCFKVLVIGISGSTKKYRLRTFSSTGEPRWNMCSGIVEGGRFRTAFMQQNPVVCRGMARWLFQGLSAFYTINVSTKSGDVFIKKLSFILQRVMYYPELEESYFGVDTKGKLMLLYLQRKVLQLMIWTWDDNGRWPDARLLMLKQPYQEKEIGVVVYTCFGENNGTLLMKDNHRRVYVADVKTGGVMHEVTDNWPRRCNLRRSKTVPLEMDWPTFLVSRLCVAT